MNDNTKPEKYKEFKKKNQELEKKKAQGFSLLKKILLGAAALLLILGSYFAFFYKASVKVNITPKEAQVKIDGKLVKKEVVNLKPGAHEVVITAQHHETYNKKVMVNYFANKPLKVDLKRIPAFKTLDSGNLSSLEYANEKNDLFYIKNGAAYRIQFDSNKPTPEKISPKVFNDIKNLKWTVKHEGVLAQLKNSTLSSSQPFNKQRGKSGYSSWFYDFNRYNLLNQTAHFLSNGLGDYDLAPNRKTAAYYYSTQTKEQSLIIDQIPKLNLNRVGRLSGFNDPAINWSPNKRYITITGSGKLVAYDTYLEEAKDLGEGDFQNSLIAPNGKTVLYTSQSSQNQPPLSIMDIEGENKKNLNINAQLKNISFADDNTFYGVGKKENKPIIFTYNLADEKLTLLNWRVDSSRFKGLDVSYNNGKIYLIKGNELVSLEIIKKGY